jgi:hypothetical protein
VGAIAEGPVPAGRFHLILLNEAEPLIEVVVYVSQVVGQETHKRVFVFQIMRIIDGAVKIEGESDEFLRGLMLERIVWTDRLSVQ